MRSKQRKSRNLRVETLECRRLLAGDVKVRFRNNDLEIIGDNASNGVMIRSTGFIDEFEVIGVTHGGSRTTINGSTRPFRFDNFDFSDDVVVKLNGGSDYLYIKGADTGDGDFDAWNDLDIEMGSGNDSVYLLNVQTGGLGATDSDVLVDLGSGDDFLSAVSVDVQDDFRIDTLETLQSLSNRTRVNISKVDVGDELDLDLHYSTAYVNIVDSVMDELYVDLYTGNDKLSLRNNKFRTGKVTGGTGTDTLYNYKNTGSLTRSSFETYSTSNRSV